MSSSATGLAQSLDGSYSLSCDGQGARTEDETMVDRVELGQAEADAVTVPWLAAQVQS